MLGRTTVMNAVYERIKPIGSSQGADVYSSAQENQGQISERPGISDK
jgi:hypothetical protein